MKLAASKILFSLLGVFLFLFILESVFRIVYRNGAPLVPYRYDNQGIPYLPSKLDLTVRFSEEDAHHYFTDNLGRRVISPSEHQTTNISIRTFGDSQALGYGLDYQQTFTHLLASTSNQQSYIWASPAIDIEQITTRICSGGVPPKEKSALDILVINLGNDLDEIFVAGQGYRGYSAAGLNGWLLQHSYTVMHWQLLQSQRRIQNNTVPGINFVLYTMNAAERVILANEIVKRVREFQQCLTSTNLLVVLMPSDFQIEPNELDKYEQYATPGSEYFHWQKKKHEAANMMNALDRYITTRLKKQNISVLSLVESHQQEPIDATSFFARQSHHLTAQGHTILAKRIQRHFEHTDKL